MKLLLTGFEPFGGEQINPALEAVNLVPDRIGTIEISKIQVPTVFGKSIDMVVSAIEQEQPDAVLCIGQAGGRAQMTPERVAINLDDASIPDNEGNQPIGRPVFPDGENALFSTLPIKAMAARMRDAGIPAAVSNTAGTFVCNHLMYGVLYTLARRFPGVRGGFMHVPFLPCQAAERPNAPCLPLEEIVRGIEESILAIEECRTDLKTAEGTIH